MKKELCAGLLLAALFIGALINIAYLRGFIGGLTDTLDISRAAAASGDFAAAEDTLRSAIEVWTEADEYTHIFIRHSEIDSTTDAFYELLSDVLSQDGESAEGAYEKLSSHLSSILTMEQVTFGSIF